MTSGSAAVAGRLSTAGLDFIAVDQQHGFLTDSLDTICIAARETPVLVRVASSGAAEIGRALDSGAAGVVVPMVEDRAQAEQIVGAALYPPAGERSFGLRHGPSTYGGSTQPPELNLRTRCFAMIESEEGLRNLAAIASSGVSGIFVGPIDLAVAFGIQLADARTLRDPRLRAMLREIAEGCSSAGVTSAIFAPSPGLAADCIELGYQTVALGSDLAVITAATTAALAATRSDPDGVAD
jgi:4-hydroxy-2-oxoheptanedioate aldolase